MIKPIFIFIISGLLIIAFAFGMGVGTYKWFPYYLVQKTLFTLSNSLTNSASYSNEIFDDFGRLIFSSSQSEIDCPKQTISTGVLISFGQSNSANYAEHLFKEKDLQGVINYFDGKCFKAKSPLLGAAGSAGEWISLTAKKLIDNKIYDNVIVVSTGIGHSSVDHWAEGNELNNMLNEVLKGVLTKYRITEFIWHQGESDLLYTHEDVYKFYFNSLENTIRKLGIDAPIFVSIASICGNENTWEYPNQISEAQKSLINQEGIELGVNTDEIIPINLRFDGCHFNKEGQFIAADEMAKLISIYRS